MFTHLAIMDSYKKNDPSKKYTIILILINDSIVKQSEC
jgi:hypothetical protein